MERIAIIGLRVDRRVDRAGAEAGRPRQHRDRRHGAHARDVSRREEARGDRRRARALRQERPPARAWVIVASPVMTANAIFEEIAPVPGAGRHRDRCREHEGGRGALGETVPARDRSLTSAGTRWRARRRQGIAAADPALFRRQGLGRLPSMTADEGAVSAVVGLAQACRRASPCSWTPRSTTAYVAAVSHLPLVLSSALFSVASRARPGRNWRSRIERLPRHHAAGIRARRRWRTTSATRTRTTSCTGSTASSRSCADSGRLSPRGESKPVFEAFTRAQLERDNYVTNGPPTRMTGEPAEKVSLGDLLLGTVVGGLLEEDRRPPARLRLPAERQAGVTSRSERRTVRPARRLRGTIAVPGDKSISHRAAISTRSRTAKPRSRTSSPATIASRRCQGAARARRGVRARRHVAAGARRRPPRPRGALGHARLR